MEGQEYLNQISASNRQTKGSGLSGILSSKLFWIGFACIVGIVILLIMGSLIGGAKKPSGDQPLSYALELHIKSTSDVINEYQPKLKSSNLRSSSASLNGILANTNNSLTSYLGEYSDKDSESLTEAAETAKQELLDDLFEAKITGRLDRVYAHKMAYEISLITTEEAKIINSTTNEELKDFLTSSYDSLNNLYDKFDNFSETK